MCSILQIRISAAGLTVSDALITLGTDGTGTHIIYLFTVVVYLFVYCCCLLLLFTGSTTVTGAEGLQSYTVQVTALQTGASDGVTITTIVTTPPGRKLRPLNNVQFHLPDTWLCPL